jgi:hypothetical protein
MSAFDVLHNNGTQNNVKLRFTRVHQKNKGLENSGFDFEDFCRICLNEKTSISARGIGHGGSIK